MGTTILVTGGAGYIGSHVCKGLYEAGFIPVCYDNFITGHRNAVKWGPCVFGDIHSTETLCKVIKEFSPKAVIHLAAYSFQSSLKIPTRYYTDNFNGSFSLLRAMQTCGLHKIVYTSTSAVYRDPRGEPLVEWYPTKPKSSYGISKLMTERLLQDYHQSYGLNYVTLRCFNVAGSDPYQILGERHTPEIHLIPQIVKALLYSEPFVTVGSTNTPRGFSCVRDYVHVTDVARAHIQAVKFLLEEPEANLTVNIGSGKGYSIFDVLKTACNVTDKDLNYSVRPARDEDLLEIVADVNHAKQALCWEPQFGLEDMIQHTWSYQQSHRIINQFHKDFIKK